MKRVEFNEDGTQLLAVTEKRMGYLGTIVVFDIKVDVEAEQTNERAMTITCEESKATVAGWSYLSKYIIAGHEDGTVSQYDAKVCGLYVNSLRRAEDTDRMKNRAESSSTASPLMKMVCKSPTYNGHPTAPTALPLLKTRPPE